MNKTKRKKRKMENTKAKRVDAAGEADTEKDVIALEAEEAVEVVAVAAAAEEVVEAVEATTTMEAEAAEDISMEVDAVLMVTLINSNITSLTFNNSNRHRPLSLCPAQWEQPTEPTRPSITTAAQTAMVGHGDSSPSNNVRDRPCLVQGIPLENLVHRTEQGTTTATLTPMATTV